MADVSDQLPRRTKIVATVGPASWDPATLRGLIEAGADVLRLNFSHSDEAKHAEIVRDIREASRDLGREVAILGDLPGPKLRVGEIPDGVVRLAPGSTITLVHGEGAGTAERVPIPRAEILDALDEGATVYMADGAIRLKVTGPADGGVEALVEVGGPLSSHKGLNLPGVDTGIDAVSEADLRWIDFSVEQELDLLAVSFVKSAADLAPVTERLDSLGSEIPVIAKIEKPEATTDEALDGILEAIGGGIMIARGDLGIEVPIAEVPSLQKRLINKAGDWSKLSITATQMLASMVNAPRPTRAEVTDVATAISDGTDAVMLSEETAVGDNPIEAVKTMDEIARATEPGLPYWEWLLNRTSQHGMDVSESVTQSAVISAYRLDLTAIVVPTASGRTAAVVAAHRPRVPILAVTHSVQTQRRLRVYFGVEPVHHTPTNEIRDLLYECADVAVRFGAAKSGDLVAIVASLDDLGLGTNLFEVHRVP